MSPTLGKALVKTMLRFRVTAGAETAIRSGHPWVFAESIREQNRQGRLGELAAIYDRKDRFLAIGLFDPDSPLRVRVLHAGNPVTIDAAWWRERLRQAIARRDGLFDKQTTGYRWINGESDGWPGLVLDRYDTTLVLKLYTAAWLFTDNHNYFGNTLRAQHAIGSIQTHISYNIGGPVQCNVVQCRCSFDLSAY